MLYQIIILNHYNIESQSSKVHNIPPDIKKYTNVFQKAKNLAVMNVFKEKTPGNSLAVQWIEFHASTEGEIVGELRSHMLNAWHGQNKQMY